MARPERNNVDYFPLYVDYGRKMFFIESKYKNDGYATWLKILCELAKADYHYLNLNDDTQVMYLAAKCNVDESTLNNIIADLVRLGEFDKEFWGEKIIYGQKFVDSISDAYKKRRNDQVNTESLRLLLMDLGILKPIKSNLKGCENPQRIVEDSKEEDKRGEEITKNEKTHPALIGFRKNVLKEAKEQGISDDVTEEFYIHWTAIDHNSGQFLFQVTDPFGIQNRLKNWNAIEQKNKPEKKYSTDDIKL